ncbi:MAG: hypothetical protein ACR2PG_26210 [Hyphomicrobiaceae bacterium]
MQLLPRPDVPAEVGQRLAAVEARPVADVSSADINKIAEQVAAVKSQMASTEAVQKNLAELAAAVEQLKKLQNTQAEAPPTNTVASDEIQARLAKIEQTFETLTTNGASGDSSNGAAGLARLAEVSGKVADLEAALTTKVTALRETLTSGLEEQASQTQNARAAARAGTRRIDRELSVIKTEAARLAQRAETLKAEQDTLTQAVGVAREQTAKLSVGLNALTGSLSERFSSVARPADIESAIKPVSSEIAALKSQLSNVVKAEIARKTNAERIVMALELGNLKRILDRGGPYDAELAEVKQMLGDTVDLTALEKFQAEGVPSASQLSSEFGKLAYAIIRAETEKKDATMIDRLLGGAQSFVRIRRADVPISDKSTEATVARIENRLKDGNLTGALAEAQKLPEKSVKPAQAWLDRVAARVGVDRAIATIERELKSSLSSQAGKKG